MKMRMKTVAKRGTLHSQHVSPTVLPISKFHYSALSLK